MTAGPLIVRIHDRLQGLAVLAAAAELGLAVRLASAPHSAGYAGVGYWHAMEGELGVPIIVDCDDDAGCIMGGLRTGLRHLVYRGDAARRVRLADMAEQMNATLLATLPEPILVLEPMVAKDLVEIRALLAGPF